MDEHPAQMRPHRQLRLLAGQDAILDGQIPRPTVGQVGVFWLLFDEVPADPHDPTLSTIDADAEPLAPPRLEPAVDAPPTMPRSWIWPILLRGDGWSATWYSRRPATGHVRLTGRLVGDLAYATTGSVRGRVTAARSMNETASAGRHEPGILADLDLDDVPPPALRPSIIPRAISAAGRMLWAADEQLPLITRIDLDDPTEIRTVVLPVPIASQLGRIPWRLHADPQGCWIAGWYGIFRATDTATIRRLDDRWVDASAAHNGTLLTCTHEKTATRIGLWYPDGHSHHDTTIPAGTVTAVTADSDGFRILLRQRDTWPVTTVVIDVDFHGRITLGPPLEGIDNHAVLIPDPAAVIDLRGTFRTIRPDLHTDPPTRWPLPGLTGGTVGTHIWIEHHDPDRDLYDDREYWLLSLIDPTRQVIARTETRTPTPDVTLDSTGTVWATDGHTIIAVHTPTGTLPPPIPLAELLDRGAAIESGELPVTTAPVRPHRRLSVLVTELAIADGEVAPPQVGDIERYALLFTETLPDETDPSIVTVDVDVEPLDEGVPLRQPAPSPYLSEEQRWWEWRLFLRGDGWTATWYSRRPTLGRQRLTGRIIGDLGYATTGSVTGRILRARIVSDTYRLLDPSPSAPPGSVRWVPVPGTRHFQDVTAATGVFRDDTRPPVHRTPGGDRIRESGVLVDLDLDDVPSPPLRPALMAAAVSAHDRDVWIIDRELPIVVRLHSQRIVGEYRFPGAILPRHAHRPRWVHADTDGCWVAGRDGIFRCTLDGQAVRIDDQPVTGSTALDGVLLSWHSNDGQSVLSLRWPDGRDHTVGTVDGRIHTVHPAPDGFIGVLHTGTDTDDPHTRLLTVDPHGQLRLGPPQPRLAGIFIDGGDRPRLIDPRRGRQHPIHPDLTVGDAETAAITGHSGGTVGPWLWVVHPGGNLRTEPNPLNDWYCLLSILDPVTFALQHRLAIHSPYPEVSYDSDGHIWIVAGGIWSLDPHSPDPAHHIRLDHLPEQ